MINKKGFLYNLSHLLWRVFKEMPFMFSLTFVVPLLSGTLSVFVYSAQADIIDAASYGIHDGKWLDILIPICRPLGIMLFITLLQALSSMMVKVFGNELKERISLLFQNEIIEIANSIEYRSFDDQEFCNKLQRAKTVVGDDMVNIFFNLTSAVSIGSSLLSIILLACSTGLYSISFAVTAMIILNLTIKMGTELRVKKLNRELTYEGRIGDYLSSALTKLSSVREMRIYNSAGYFLNLWGSTIKKQHYKRMNARRMEIKLGMVVSTIQACAVFIVLAEMISHMPSSQSITIGMTSTLFLALIQSGSKIMSLTWPLSKLYISCSRLYDFHEVLSMRKELQQSSRLYSEGSTNKNNNLVPIVLSDVSFSYRNSGNKILSNINLTINKNEKIALVGANGAGKSTLVKLILGLYSPDSGSITWNGSNRPGKKISVVFQNYIKFELTLRENIAAGSTSQINNDDLILETMKKCNCYSLYEELGSLDIPLGRMIQGGRELSGGQWQKLAICRAIFGDSDLLIFDEPTASIDANAEAEVFSSIMDICKNRTSIFISHRLGWAKNADRIILINNGRIEEMGTHNELISLGGIYSGMYSTQASWYAPKGA